MSTPIRLVSFLGASPYIPVRYSLDGRSSDRMFTYVQSAICKLLEPDIVEATILTTAEAERKNGAALTQELASVGVHAVTQVPIPDGHSEEELWQIFTAVGQSLQGAARFIFDITHGFRSLPATGVFSLAFYLHLLPASLHRILYGAFEAVADEQGRKPPVPEGKRITAVMKEMPDEQRRCYVAPVLDLTPMHTVTLWAEAAGEWQRTGRAAGIVALTQPFTTAIARQLRHNRPQALTGLPGRLKLLDDALTLVRHDKIAECADALQQIVEEAGEQAAGTPQLAPLITLVRQLGESVAPLIDHKGAAAPGGPAHLSYLRGQLAAAEWHGARGRIVEAFSLLREAVTSSAVLVVAMAGSEGGPSGARPMRSDSTAFRTQCDRLVAGASGTHDHQNAQRSTPADDPEDAAAAVAPASAAPASAAPHPDAESVASFLASKPLLAEAFARAWNAVQSTRNKLNHCWTGDHSRQNFRSSTMNEVQRDFEQALVAVRGLVELLPDEQSQEPDATQPQAAPGLKPGEGSESRREQEQPGRATEGCPQAGDTPDGSEGLPAALPDPPPPQARFVNFSNHPLATWSLEQLAAARALGLGEPADLDGGMPLVPPAADRHEVARLAEELVEQAGPGLRGACVFGELSLTVALLRLLQQRGVRCFTSTTERISEERRQPDGSVIKENRFRFVRWREYLG